jgi:transglutaminase-like putative cysteine protease
VTAAFSGVPEGVSRSHRRLLGGLLLWSLVPLPFVYILLPPFWITGALVGLWRVLWPDRVWRPGLLVQNAAGLVALAAVVAAGGLSVGPLRPLGHLLVLLTATRVAMARDLNDARRALPVVFLTWVVSVVSSFHVAVLPYFVASVVVWWYVGMRVLLDGLSADVGDDLGRPNLRHIAVATMASIVVAVPLFMVLPRLGSPILAGPSLGRTSGFSNSVQLSRRGSIQESAEMALSLETTDGKELEPAWARIRAGAFTLVSPGVWTYHRHGLFPIRPDADGRVWLTSDIRSLDGARPVLIRQRHPNRFIFVPEGAVAIEVPGLVYKDPGGGLQVPRRNRRAGVFRVWALPEPPFRGGEPEPRHTELPSPNPAVGDLAAEIVGGRRGLDAARRIETYLKQEYAYSLSDGGRPGGDPVAWFLLERRAGHCEYFASAMVDLLRHLDIPARLVSGYHGGDLSDTGERMVVRQSNAHTWVEAWGGPDRGWVVFDPTPSDGVDGFTRLSLVDELRLLFEDVEIFFDRSILGYNLGDQASALEALALRVAALGRADGRTLAVPVVVALVVGALVLAGVSLRRRLRRTSRRRGPAARAMARVARRLDRGGVAVPAGATVGWIAEQAARRWDGAGGTVRELAARADAELYGPKPIDRHADDVERLWRDFRSSA